MQSLEQAGWQCWPGGITSFRADKFTVLSSLGVFSHSGRHEPSLNYARPQCPIQRAWCFS
jgi:hypothetical protein